jgi:Asp-tRNA(Asn)/Glu-tRNA(Gln) amidotransferase C subunit
MAVERFSLEQLSKIAWATSSDDVFKLFTTLDAYITDEEVAAYIQTWSSSRTSFSHTILRDDSEGEENLVITKSILDNFPEQEERLLVVPQII